MLTSVYPRSKPRLAPTVYDCTLDATLPKLELHWSTGLVTVMTGIANYAGSVSSLVSGESLFLQLAVAHHPKQYLAHYRQLL